MQTLSQRNGRHASSALRAGDALQNPAYRLADVLKMRGSAQHAGPLAISGHILLGFLSLVPTIHSDPVRLPYDLKRAPAASAARCRSSCAPARADDMQREIRNCRAKRMKLRGCLRPASPNRFPTYHWDRRYRSSMFRLHRICVPDSR